MCVFNENIFLYNAVQCCQDMKPTYNKNYFCSLLFISSLTIVVMQYYYPARKSSKYSFTVYKNRKIDGTSNIIETHSNYEECINSCYNKKEKCKSIDVKIEDKNTLTCRFFEDDFPKTKQAEGFLNILTKPPNCSLSCSATMNPCGKCDCKPSCSARNQRQHICNCSNAAGVTKNCLEHYNNGFNKTGVYQISPNGSTFMVVCEMGKVEQRNPIVTNPICNALPSNLQFSFNSSVSYCVVTCASYSSINIMFFNIYSGCYCGNYLGWYYNKIDPDLQPVSTQSDYCIIGPSSKSCKLSKVSSTDQIYYNSYIYIGYISWSSCMNFCVDYQKKNPTQNGYVASAIVDVYGDCQCLYGFSGQTTSFKLGCSFFETLPPTALPNVKVNEHVLTRNNLLSILTSLEKTYSVSFKLNLISITSFEKNVIHLTIGDNYGNYGYRVSSVWTISGRLYFRSAVNGNVNFEIYTDILPLNVWSNIKISQIKQNGLYKYKIYINESVIYSTTNTNPQTFSNVYVYVTNPWYYAADGSIKDLKIVNENDYFSDKCADDWIYNQNHCYFFNIITTNNWQDSYSSCLNYGGNLLSVSDEAENLFIKNQLQDDTIKDQNFWIGLNDQRNENIFEWSDNTSVLIYNWMLNEPNNYKESEDCVIANSVGWNDVPCDSLYGFICKAKSETSDPVEQKLISGNLNATLSLLDKTYSVSFKLKPNSYSQGWKSVIHLTIGGNLGQYGDRCPAVWFHGDGSGRLYISAAVNGNKDYTFTTQPLPLNQWSSLRISQFQTNGIYMYTIYLNELLVHSVINKKPQSFSNVKVYTADPWYDAQDGFIKDLKIITGFSGVWIPMMTRFASWESSFWSKSYDAYENGFGLFNQQWIGLKKIYQITNTFFTDMRVDYIFEESITLSTMYYNVIIGSSEDNYVFNYEKYDPRGSFEPDRFNANGTTFKSCSMWWTTSCDISASPTSLYNISYGLTENLVAIYFSLRTKEIKEKPFK
ncbi:uncharacterized protein LOC100201473 isoform X1 [Hydra vulgaris]|uniref:uncharacterized protein LOC100201473 isoform X1 n=1 Tax=Hydra vulgaris TaxID=6087 RepID=UPI0032EA427E